MDEKKIETVIARSSPSQRKLLRWLFNHIRFVDRGEFEMNMERSIRDAINDLKKREGDLYIWFNIISKFGSEHWLCLKYIDMFKQELENNTTSIHFAYSTDDIPTDRKVNLIMIDDATYSGTYALSQIDTIFHEVSNPDLKISLIIPFYTEFAMEGINDLCMSSGRPNSVTHFGSSRMKTVCDLADEEGFTINWLAFNQILYPELKHGNDRETYNPTTTWFRHKIANNFGTLTGLIEECCLIKPSREEINEVRNRLEEPFELCFKIGSIISETILDDQYDKPVIKATLSGDLDYLSGLLAKLTK